jgi:hypothetical protein
MTQRGRIGRGEGGGVEGKGEMVEGKGGLGNR